MYQALYRKWRPKTFSQVVGQDHITGTLQRQVAEGRTAHAYLFTGTRGTGKTTCARILAKAVNCLHPEDGAPCNQCEACRGIDSGSLLDVTELDAASNSRVDDIRELLSESVYTPTVLKKRVYIIDEVHMLSTQAFNALLKTIEEPPEHLMFILATTELHKVPATILSRCQRFTFKRILPRDMEKHLLEIARAEQIDLIGSHGQTFWHIPLPETYLGHSFRSTFQLGEGSVLAQRFGCPVVSDFRVRDVAADGLGAPLVPYSEFLIYRSETECVALQNIGGIGNITCLFPACRLEDVFAFDTGPGNMVMDAVYTELTGGEKTFDEGGAYAAGGKVHEKLLEMLMQDAYLSRKPPKTTGREYYGPDFVKKVMDYARRENISGQDLMATVTDYTAQTIRYSVEHYFPRKPDKLIIGGGGSMNKTLVQAVARALPECRVLTNEDLGYDSNAKEAVAFAVMANETIFAGYNNVPTVTGAKNPVVMGKISL